MAPRLAEDIIVRLQHDSKLFPCVAAGFGGDAHTFMRWFSLSSTLMHKSAGYSVAQDLAIQVVPVQQAANVFDHLPISGHCRLVHSTGTVGMIVARRLCMPRVIARHTP